MISSARRLSVAAPRNRNELADLLGQAADAGRQVRVAGSGHSFTDICLTDGLLLDLSRMNRVLDVDRANGLARVEAGLTLHAASPALHNHGLAFPNLGDIDAQTIAGAIATATHGTGATLQNLSAAVHSVELMRPDGSVVELNEQSDPDGWRAARVNLGALGVVTAMTLRLVPSFVLEGIERPVPVEEVLDDLDTYVEGNDHFEFYMFAHSPLAMTKRNNRVDLAEQPRPQLVDWFADILMSNYTFDALSPARSQAAAAGAVDPPRCRLRGQLPSSGGPVLPGVRLAAPDPLHRDGIRHSARTFGRGHSRDQRAVHPLRHPDADRGALGRAR